MLIMVNPIWKPRSCPPRLDASEEEVHRHAQHQPQHQFTGEHHHQFEGMRRHDSTRQRKAWPQGHGHDEAQGHLHLHGHGVTAEEGQQEHHEAHAHEGEQKAKGGGRVESEEVHATR